MVYEAVCRDTGAVRAVKVMRKEGRDSSSRRAGLRRAAREVKAMEAVAGLPGVAALVDKFETPHCVFLATELARGGDLLALAKAAGGTLSEAQLCLLLRQCLTVLRSLHEREVVHGDVTPVNWLIAHPLAPAELDGVVASWAPGQAPLVRVIDFGSSQTLEAHGHKLRRRTGTPVYMAPEVFARSYDTAADVYSLGVTFYQLAAGRLPFWPTLHEAALAGREQVQRAVLEAPVRFDGDPWAAMSPGAAHLLRWMLRRDPALRPTAAQALAHPWLQLQAPPAAAAAAGSPPEAAARWPDAVAGAGELEAAAAAALQGAVATTQLRAAREAAGQRPAAAGAAARPAAKQGARPPQRQERRARAEVKPKHPFHDLQLGWSWS